MASIDKAESMVAGWLKSVPHLPVAGQKWVAQNVWWIALVGAIASAIGVLITVSAIFTYLAIDPSVYYLVPVYGPGWMIAEVIGMLFAAAIAIILGLAISPLKEMKRRGWNALFLIILVEAVRVIVVSILSLSIIGFIFGLIFGAIGIAIITYFIFEIRSYFGGARVVTRKKTRAAKA